MRATAKGVGGDSGDSDSSLHLEDLSLMNEYENKRQSLESSLAADDILFQNRSDLSMSFESKDPDHDAQAKAAHVIFSNGADFLHSVQQELADCKAENSLLKQEVDGLMSQLTVARAQLAEYEQQAAWKALENMRLSSSNSKLLKKLNSSAIPTEESPTLSRPDTPTLNLTQVQLLDENSISTAVARFEQAQLELQELREKLKECEEELALKQEICYSQSRQLVELKRQLDLSASIDGGKASSGSRRPDLQQLYRDSFSGSRSGRGGLPNSTSAKVKLFSPSVEEDIQYTQSKESNPEPAIEYSSFFPQSAARSPATLPSQRGSISSKGSGPRTGDVRVRDKTTSPSRKKEKVFVIDGSDDLIMRINDLEVALRVRSAEVSSLVSQLNEAEAKSAEYQAVASEAEAKLSQMEQQILLFNTQEHQQLLTEGFIEEKVEQESALAQTVEYQEANGGVVEATVPSPIYHGHVNTPGIEFEAESELLETLRSENIHLNEEVSRLQSEMSKKIDEFDKLKEQFDLSLQKRKADGAALSESQAREAALLSQLSVLEVQYLQQKKQSDDSWQERMNKCDERESSLRDTLKLLISTHATTSATLSSETAAKEEVKSLLREERLLLEAVKESNRTLEQNLHLAEQASQSLREELDRTKEHVVSISKELATLSASSISELDEAKNALATSERERVTLQIQFSELLAEQAGIRAKIQQLDVDNIELKNLAVQSTSETEKARISLEASEGKIKVLNEELAAVARKLQATQSELNDVNAANQDLRTQLAASDKRFNEASSFHLNQIRNLQKELATEVELSSMQLQSLRDSLEAKDREASDRESEMQKKLLNLTSLLSRSEAELRTLREQETISTMEREDLQLELRRTDEMLSEEKLLVVSLGEELQRVLEMAMSGEENSQMASEELYSRRIEAFDDLIEVEVETALRLSLLEVEKRDLSSKLQHSFLDFRGKERDLRKTLEDEAASREFEQFSLQDSVEKALMATAEVSAERDRTAVASVLEVICLTVENLELQRMLDETVSIAEDQAFELYQLRSDVEEARNQEEQTRQDALLLMRQESCLCEERKMMIEDMSQHKINSQSNMEALLRQIKDSVRQECGAISRESVSYQML